MGFFIRIGSALVTADTAAEAAELVRALGVVAPEPANETTPPAVATRAPRAARPIGRGSVQERRPGRWVVILSVGKTTRFGGAFPTQAEAEAAQETIYQARLRGEPIPVFGSARPCGRCRKHGHLRRECQTPEAELLVKSKIDEPERRAKIAAGVTAYWGKRHAEDPIAHKYRASARRHMDGWALGLVIEGKARWGGTFGTEAEAITARDAWLAAARAGAELPDFRKRLLRCRCGSMDHGTKLCPDRSWSVPSRLPAPARAEAPEARLAARAKPAKPPAAPAVPIGSAECRAKIAQAMKDSWARRRAARALALGGAPAPAVAPKPPRAPRPAPPAPAPAQRPPACVRCIRVGHVEADCPASNEPAKQEHTVGDESLPSVATQVIRPIDADSSSYDAADDDEGTDLTDLVDVPDAEPTPSAPDDEDSAWRCHACGKLGHRMGRPECPLSAPTERTTPVPAPAPVFRLTTIPPRTRGDCLSMPRPCPFIVCRHHLSPERPGVPLAKLAETCTLDLADRGPITLEEVGRAFGLTRERIRQVEAKATKRLATNARRHRIDFELPIEQGSNAPEDSL